MEKYLTKGKYFTFMCILATVLIFTLIQNVEDGNVLSKLIFIIGIGFMSLTGYVIGKYNKINFWSGYYKGMVEEENIPLYCRLSNKHTQQIMLPALGYYTISLFLNFHNLILDTIICSLAITSWALWINIKLKPYIRKKTYR